MIARLIGLIGAAAVGLSCSGCGPSVWAEHFIRAPGIGERDLEPLDPDAPVTIRRVEWERLTSYDDAARARAIGRDLPPDLWPPDVRTAETADFLRALRILEDPADVRRLGSASFVHPGRLSPFAGSLERFARSIGAAYAVVSERPVGLRETVIYAPMTTYYDRVVTGRGKHRSHHDDGRSDDDRDYRVERGSATTYVPTVIAVDSFHYVVYFVASDGATERRSDEGEAGDR